MPTARKRWIGWIVAAVIIVIIVAIALTQLGPPPPVEETGVHDFWADPDVIRPGDCTVLRWDAPGWDSVRVVGPGTDSDLLMPPGGELPVCPEATSLYELMGGPEWEVLAEIVIEVRE